MQRNLLRLEDGGGDLASLAREYVAMSMGYLSDDAVRAQETEPLGNSHRRPPLFLWPGKGSGEQLCQHVAIAEPIDGKLAASISCYAPSCFELSLASGGMRPITRSANWRNCSARAICSAA